MLCANTLHTVSVSESTTEKNTERVHKREYHNNQDSKHTYIQTYHVRMYIYTTWVVVV